MDSFKPVVGCDEGELLAERRFVSQLATTRSWRSLSLSLRRPEVLTMGSQTELPPTSTRLETDVPCRMVTCKTRSRGTRQRLPEVQVLTTESTGAIVSVSVCLTDTFRSQGFSPSQRLDPAQASWLCFTPHPPLGHPAFRAFLRVSSLRTSRYGLLSRRSACCRSPWALRLLGDLASTALGVHQATSLTPGLNTTHPQPHTSPTAAREHHRAHVCDRNRQHVLNEWFLHHCRFLPVRSRVDTRKAPKQERTPGSNTQDKASASELSSGHHVRASAREFTPRFGRCSPGLSPFRVISVEARRATHSPHALRSAVSHHAVLQGIYRTSPRTHSCEWLQPSWSFLPRLVTQASPQPRALAAVTSKSQATLRHLSSQHPPSFDWGRFAAL